MSSVCLFTDTGSSSSEDEGPKRPTAGPGARNGDVRRRRSRTPSPRRRHRDVSPRSDTSHSTCTILSESFHLMVDWNPSWPCLAYVLFFYLYPFRKRRSPSPGRRRRSPSPPRRRRSPSPPRRRYRHVDFISVAIICVLMTDNFIRVFEFGASQVSFPTSASSFSIPQTIFSSYPATLQPLTFATTEKEVVQLTH